VLSEQISSNRPCLFCQVYSHCCLPLVKHAHFAFLLLCLLSSTWFSCTVELHFLEKKWGLHTAACINCKSLLFCARQALPHLRDSAPPNTPSAQCLEHRPASCLPTTHTTTQFNLSLVNKQINKYTLICILQTKIKIKMKFDFVCLCVFVYLFIYFSLPLCLHEF